jgi:RNA polymerase sigma-70 factor (ECF subfamily)
VLHHAFEMPYEQIGRVLGRSAATARQLASRARRRLARSSGEPSASRAERAEVLGAFRAAYERGDMAGLVSLLAPGVVYLTDGGGEVRAARKRIVGALRVATVLTRVAARLGPAVSVAAEVNGEAGLLLFRDGRLFSVDTFDIRGGQIIAIHRVLSPAKLSRLPSHRGLPCLPPVPQ